MGGYSRFPPPPRVNSVALMTLRLRGTSPQTGCSAQRGDLSAWFCSVCSRPCQGHRPVRLAGTSAPAQRGGPEPPRHLPVALPYLEGRRIGLLLGHTVIRNFRSAKETS